MTLDVADLLREPILIVRALWPAAPLLVEFKNGLFAVAPGSRWSLFMPDEEWRRAPTWEEPLRAAALAGGIHAERIDRMIAEVKRARREMSSPFFGDDDARRPA